MKLTTAATLFFCAWAAAALPAAGGARPQQGTATKPSAAPTKDAPKKAVQGAGPAAPKKTAALPQVRELDEVALKALLDENRRGGRRLLVNFWATWCTPCREEFPDLVKIDREFAGRDDFEFITISLDDPSEIAKSVPEFLSETGAGSIPAYLMNAKDPEAVITLVNQGMQGEGRAWHGDLPATFLFGRDGAVLFRHTGRVKPDELRRAIEGSDKAATGR